MSLTDQERFQQVLRESGLEKTCFPQPDEKRESYFEDIEFQPRLAIYNPENVNDVRRELDTIMEGEGFGQLKQECIKSIMKSLISWEAGEQQDEIHARNAGIQIPEFIYNF